MQYIASCCESYLSEILHKRTYAFNSPVFRFLTITDDFARKPRKLNPERYGFCGQNGGGNGFKGDQKDTGISKKCIKPHINVVVLRI